MLNLDVADKCLSDNVARMFTMQVQFFVGLTTKGGPEGQRCPILRYDDSTVKW